MFKKYAEYLKDNPEGYWFKRRLFGWGWVPVTARGWLVVIGFIAFVLWNAFKFNPEAQSGNPSFWFLARIYIAILVLLIICYKTGEPPRWQWGLPKDKGNGHSD